MIKKINSKSNEYIKDLAKLKSKKIIQEKELFLVEGKNLINEAINSGIVETLLISNEKLYSNYDLDKVLVTDEIITKLSSNKSNNGIIAVCKYYKPHVNLKLVNKIVVLENINNPGNFGTIIRTALAFGFDAVISVGNSVFSYNEKVIKASQGAIFKMPVMQLKSYEELKNFKAYKFVLAKDSKKLDDLKIEDSKYALVFGNEANGLTQEIKDNWKGENIFIDIKNIDSLNLAIAVGITLNKFK